MSTWLQLFHTYSAHMLTQPWAGSAPVMILSCSLGFPNCICLWLHCLNQILQVCLWVPCVFQIMQSLMSTMLWSNNASFILFLLSLCHGPDQPLHRSYRAVIEHHRREPDFSFLSSFFNLLAVIDGLDINVHWDPTIYIWLLQMKKLKNDIYSENQNVLEPSHTTSTITNYFHFFICLFFCRRRFISL